MLHKLCYKPAAQGSYSVKSVQAADGCGRQCTASSLLFQLLPIRYVKWFTLNHSADPVMPDGMHGFLMDLAAGNS
ncbi:hypothetical protein F3Y22_tig00111057pilonHSYRG00064 [Hibiscus syriacus]|uniref:Uncharacterized protein n=1 Tax=Hibiscus syriacus TaxID=106335 RepID=A0A6A2Z567_HIBSY|nr:hypothetical protein F3Y22_tig00111057pilonHSYRG00064 [Hibiscus syriacus]